MSPVIFKLIDEIRKWQSLSDREQFDIIGELSENRNGDDGRAVASRLLEKLALMKTSFVETETKR